MKKTLAIIAAAVMLLTVFAWVLYIIDTSASNQVLGTTKYDGLALAYGLIVLGFILIAEIAFFYGIALILSKNRTPLKLVLGAVIVIISLIFLISLIKSFFRI
ncbi:MAG: hypothetical protein IKS90_07785 [Clostridia bacterium]|nr:hypothetical protein [Clostridia bacterium]